MVNLHLDVSKQGATNPTVYLRVGDHQIDTLHVLVTDDYQLFDLTGYSISFEGLNAAGTKILDSNVESADNGEFDYTIPQNVATNPGQYQVAYFSFSKDGMRTTTGNFRLIVINEVDLTAAEAKDFISEYEKMKSALQSEFDETKKLLTTDVDNFKTSAGSVIQSAASNATSTADSASTYIKGQTSAALSEAKSQTSEAASQAISTANSSGSHAKSVADSAASAASNKTASAIADVKSQTASAGAFVESAAASGANVMESAASQSVSYAASTNAIAKSNADLSNSMAAAGLFASKQDVKDATSSGEAYADNITSQAITNANSYASSAATNAGSQATKNSNSYADYIGSEAIDYNLGDGMHWIAHRGNNQQYPENSLMAFKTVTRHWGIESDTSVTSDGKWVIMHDDTVDRMTNGTGKIANLTYDQFKALKFDAGSGIDRINDEMKTPPSMEEFFQTCKANNKVPVMEIKSAAYSSKNYDDFVAIVKKYGLEKSMIVISFAYEALQEVKKRLPYINVSWLTGSYTNDEADKANALGVNSGIDTGTYNSLTAENIEYAHNLGLKLGVWTPSDDADRETFKRLGVDCVTTDSQSGDLRFAKPTLNKSWTNVEDMYSGSYVEEISPGIIHIVGLMGTGNKDDRVKGTVVAYLPEWATPYSELWNQAIVRTDGGLISSTIDLVGRKSIDFNGTTAALKAGIAWDTGGSWVSFNLTYHI